MRIERLALNGVLRFGVPVELDFTTLPPGLIAVVGANGEGKSTLLEAMIAGFYREFPSRGQAIDYATEKNSYIDVTAAFDEKHLRARVSMDGVQRISDAVLMLEDELGQSHLNDGKVTNFDKAVADHFPPLAQLLASSFSAQNRRGTFSTLDKKGRRDLFASLLGLAQLEAHAATARQAGLMVDRRLAELRALADRLAAETTEAQQVVLENEETGLSNRDAGGREALRVAVKLVGELERRQERAAVDAGAYTRAQQAKTAARDRQDALKADLRIIEAEAVEMTRAFERRRRECEAALTRIIDREGFLVGSLPAPASVEALRIAAIKRIDLQVDASRQDRTDRIANNEGLLQRAENIRSAVREVETLTTRVSHLEGQMTALLERRAGAGERVNALAVEKARLSTTDRDLTAAQTSAALLERVPFGPKCVEAGCELVQSARTAKDLIPSLEAQRARLLEIQAEIAEANRDLLGYHEQVSELQTALGDERNRLAILGPVAGLLPKLDAAETRVAELKAEIVALEQQATVDRDQAHADAAVADRKRTQQIDESADVVSKANAETEQQLREIATQEAHGEEYLAARRVPIDAELATVAVALVDADAELARLAPAHDALATIDRELVSARERVSTEQTAAARLEAEREAFERRRAEFSRRLGERITLVEARTALEQDLVEWQALARIFGPEGLPVLEIDAAGPGVSALANDLLHACFGSRFTVELVTQEAKASGKGLKEVFELKVYDGERGGEARDLTDLSGGEQVLVDEALKSAIALFVNQRNVMPIRTCWRDETTGALDPENALRYIAMLRRVHERGGLHHLFFVSHNPEAAALADAQIVVAGGKAEIVLPPFTPRAAA